MAIVTVSRQIGSWGDEIAAVVAKNLNYQLAGPEQMESLAKSLGADYQKAFELFEGEVPQNFWERRFLNEPSNASLFKALKFELASQGDVVIVGRGAQIVLGEIPGVIKVRVVAPAEVRARRLMEKQEMEFEKALEFIEHYGHQRRVLIQQIYHKDVTDWSLYDLIINTHGTGVSTAAAIIQEAVKAMDPKPDEAELKANLKRQAQAKIVESKIRKAIPPTNLGTVEVCSPSAGTLSIKGYVTDEKSKIEAESLAAKTEGIKDVDSGLNVVYFWGFSPQ